jgi:hypothetical protein
MTKRLKGIRAQIHRRLDQRRRQAPQPRKRVVVHDHNAKRRVSDDDRPEREIEPQQVETRSQRNAGDDPRQRDRQDEQQRKRITAEKLRPLQCQR